MPVGIDSSLRRRIDLKAVDTAGKLERDASILRGLEQKRKVEADAVVTGKETFELMRRRLMNELQGGRSARETAKRIDLGITGVHTARQKVAEAHQTLQEATAVKNSQEIRVQTLRHRLASLGEKVGALSAAGSRERGRREEDDGVSTGIVRHFSTIELMPPPPLTPHDGEAPRVPEVSLHAATAARTQFDSQDVRTVRSSDSLERSDLMLSVSRGSDLDLDVRLIRRGDRDLEVQIDSRSYGEQRKLWDEQEELRERLSQAGYRVGRFTITRGNGQKL